MRAPWDERRPRLRMVIAPGQPGGHHPDRAHDNRSELAVDLLYVALRVACDEHRLDCGGKRVPA
jgi:hypothetical protein